MSRSWFLFTTATIKNQASLKNGKFQGRNLYRVQKNPGTSWFMSTHQRTQNDSGKKYYHLLKLLDKILWDTGYLQSLKVSPQRMPINYKEKNWFFSGRTWRTSHQVIKNYTTRNETIVWTFRYCSLIHLCSTCSIAQSCSTLCKPMDCVAHQAPLYMDFSRQEYSSGLPFPTPGDLLNWRSNLHLLH